MIVINNEQLSRNFSLSGNDLPDAILYDQRDRDIVVGLKKVKVNHEIFSERTLDRIVMSIVIEMLKNYLPPVKKMTISLKNLEKSQIFGQNNDRLQIIVQKTHSCRTKLFFFSAKITNQTNKLVGRKEIIVCNIKFQEES